MKKFITTISVKVSGRALSLESSLIELGYRLVNPYDSTVGGS